MRKKINEKYILILNEKKKNIIVLIKVIQKKINIHIQKAFIFLII